MSKLKVKTSFILNLLNQRNATSMKKATPPELLAVRAILKNLLMGNLNLRTDQKSKLQKYDDVVTKASKSFKECR